MAVVACKRLPNTASTDSLGTPNSFGLFHDRVMEIETLLLEQQREAELVELMHTLRKEEFMGRSAVEATYRKGLVWIARLYQLFGAERTARHAIKQEGNNAFAALSHMQSQEWLVVRKTVPSPPDIAIDDAGYETDNSSSSSCSSASSSSTESERRVSEPDTPCARPKRRNSTNEAKEAATWGGEWMYFIDMDQLERDMKKGREERRRASITALEEERHSIDETVKLLEKELLKIFVNSGHAGAVVGALALVVGTARYSQPAATLQRVGRGLRARTGLEFARNADTYTIATLAGCVAIWSLPPPLPDCVGLALCEEEREEAQAILNEYASELDILTVQYYALQLDVVRERALHPLVVLQQATARNALHRQFAAGEESIARCVLVDGEEAERHVITEKYLESYTANVLLTQRREWQAHTEALEAREREERSLYLDGEWHFENAMDMEQAVRDAIDRERARGVLLLEEHYARKVIEWDEAQAGDANRLEWEMGAFAASLMLEVTMKESSARGAVERAEVVAWDAALTEFKETILQAWSKVTTAVVAMGLSAPPRDIVHIVGGSKTTSLQIDFDTCTIAMGLGIAAPTLCFDAGSTQLVHHWTPLPPHKTFRQAGVPHGATLFAVPVDPSSPRPAPCYSSSSSSTSSLSPPSSLLAPHPRGRQLPSLSYPPARSPLTLRSSRPSSAPSLSPPVRGFHHSRHSTPSGTPSTPTLMGIQPAQGNPVWGLKHRGSR